MAMGGMSAASSQLQSTSYSTAVGSHYFPEALWSETAGVAFIHTLDYVDSSEAFYSPADGTEFARNDFKTDKWPPTPANYDIKLPMLRMVVCGFAVS